MKIYVIDVVDMKNYYEPEYDHPRDDGEETIPEMIYLHRDLIRGCTNSYIVMRKYYDYMQELIGNYVELVVYEYDIRTSYDMPKEFRDLPKELQTVDWEKGEEIDDDVLAAIGLTLYNNPDRNEIKHSAASMPVLIRYPLENGEMYVINSAAQEVFNEIYFTECEYGLLFRFVALFIYMKKYIKPIAENPILIEMYNVLESEFDEIKYDFYNPDLRWHVDPIGLNKLHIDSLDVFRR